MKKIANEPVDPLVDLSRRALVKSITAAVSAVAIAPCHMTAANHDKSSREDGELSFPSLSSPSKEQLTSYTIGNFVIDVSKRCLRVRHRGDDSRILWETNPEYPFIRVGRGEATFREHGNPLGTFDVTDDIMDLRTFESVDSATVIDKTGLNLIGTLSSSRGKVGFHLTFLALSANHLQFAVEIEGPNPEYWNRIFLKYSSSRKEAFFGFGQQLTYFNQKGQILPILVQEHGIGRGLPIVTRLIDLAYDGAGGNPRLTEAPAPHYITSELRSLFLENKEYSTFDMRASDAIEIKLFSGRMTGRILFGRTPLDLIEEYSSYAGRMRPLPAWVHEGVMVAAQGGDERVNDILTKLLGANVPLSGLWIQDWSGTKSTGAGQQVLWNWQLNTTKYPKWNDLVDRLAQHNARVLIYINPFLVENLCGPDQPPCPGKLYTEAESKGYFVKQNGRTFEYKNSTITAGMLDLSNPDAYSWTKELIKRELITNARGSGWMADFGEALPFNADLFGGADPHIWHNHYPEAWARLHREAIEETGRGDDFLFWNRSGFTQSPGVSTSFWLGDQLQTWDEYDGIKTAVVGLLSGGVSAFSLLHSDTGGFVAGQFRGIPIIARSEELLMRWMELNAFTAIFRTHEGLIPKISAQVTDPEALSHLARFGQIYKLLGPYRKTLVEEAFKSGYPVVRHLFLHYPRDLNVLDLRYQFLLGSDFLVAPVLDKGAKKVRVYLPAGDWTHVWSGRPFHSVNGMWTEVAAPLGQPGVFFRSGSEAGEEFVSALKAQNVLKS